jgi:hypothetical protein
MAGNGLVNFEGYQGELISLVALRKLSAPQLSAGPLGNLRERKVGKAFLCSNVLSSAFFKFVSIGICLLRKFSAFTKFGFMGLW